MSGGSRETIQELAERIDQFGGNSSCPPAGAIHCSNNKIEKERTNMIDWNPIAKKFREADAILIGASNGLSITEGLHLFADNGAFERLFGDFKRKYGLRCIFYLPCCR